MSEAVIAQTAPYEMELEPGTYYWCACGRSKDQPRCDGSHAGTGFEPLAFKVDKPGKVWLCGCRRTKTPPFCDGAHQSLKEGA
ncbi:CDGSH iron-sulfur domain-containing protein [Endothiovibrio diazotrophicus]